MARESLTRDDMLNRIASHGVVGAGGGGFPTHIKLAAKADCIILNAAECEPLLHKDKEMLRQFGQEVLTGLTMAAELVGASEIVVGIKGKYSDVIETLTPMLPANGRIVPLSDSYPSGDEFILVYDVTGKIIPPGEIPLAVGCVVINVETAYNIAANAPVTDTFLTVAGEVANPVTLRLPVGTSVAEAIELAGGVTVDDPRIVSGGVMMGSLIGMDSPITKTCGGLIVLGRDHYVVRRYEAPWKTIARQGAAACDQCSFCTELCPRYLLGHPVEPHKAMRSLGFTADKTAFVEATRYCVSCNLCTMMACPEDLDPKSVCTDGKSHLPKLDASAKPQAHPYRASLQLDNRRVPINRLMLKLGLAKFRNEGPMQMAEYQPQSVALPLKQHAGAPAVAVVKSGQHVERGALIASPAEGNLGANIHASISGWCEAAEDQVVIRVDQDKSND